MAVAIISIAESGVSFVLKQSTKKVFSILALSKSLLAFCPLCSSTSWFSKTVFWFNIDRLLAKKCLL